MLKAVDSLLAELQRAQTSARRSRDSRDREARLLRLSAEIRSLLGLKSKLGVRGVIATPDKQPADLCNCARVRAMTTSEKHQLIVEYLWYPAVRGELLARLHDLGTDNEMVVELLAALVKRGWEVRPPSCPRQ